MSFGQMTKVEIFGSNAQRHLWQKPDTAYQHKHITPIIQRAGESVMILACLQPQGLRTVQSFSVTPLYTHQEVSNIMAEKEKKVGTLRETCINEGNVLKKSQPISFHNNVRH